MSSNPKWPYPGDSEVERARKIALMYRQHLHTKAPDVCEQLDQVALGYGERWAAPHVLPYEPEDAITTGEAAELVGVSPEMIRHWARLPHPDDPGRMLLPRFRRRGRDMTYLVTHVEAALAAYRRQLSTRTRA